MIWSFDTICSQHINRLAVLKNNKSSQVFNAYQRNKAFINWQLIYRVDSSGFSASLFWLDSVVVGWVVSFRIVESGATSFLPLRLARTGLRLIRFSRSISETFDWFSSTFRVVSLLFEFSPRFDSLSRRLLFGVFLALLRDKFDLLLTLRRKFNNYCFNLLC